MPNRKQLIAYCRGCGRPRDDDERFSARGRCLDCGRGHMERNAEQLAAHAGPYFDHWRQRCAAAFGAILLREPPIADRPELYASTDGDDRPA